MSRHRRSHSRREPWYSPRRWFAKKPQPIGGETAPAPALGSVPGSAPAAAEGDTKSITASHSRRRRWVFAQRLKRLIPGLPALLALMFWPLVGAIAWRSTSTSERRYATYADEALRDRDYQGARIACEHLLQLDTQQQPLNTFRMAASLLGLGQKEAALQLFNALVPVSSKDFGVAHLAIANLILRDQESTAAALRVAEAHLKQSLATGNESVLVLEMLGQYYSRIGDWKQAREYFTRGYAYKKELALPLAAVAQAQGDKEEMKRWAAEAALLFEVQAKKTKDTATPRLNWAQALLMLKDYPGALEVVNDGLREKELPSYHQLAADVIAQWLEAAPVRADNLAGRMALIQQGLAHDPLNFAVLKELVVVSHMRGGEAARTTLNSLLARGESAATAHFVLGLDEWQNKDYEKARQHFEIVFKLYPKMSMVANNLAWLLTFSEPHDYTRALLIMDELMKRFPDSPVFHETRGEVLVKLGRWREAVTDLEFALPWHKENARTHSSLAQAYGALGLKELAAEHQRLAQSAGGAKAH